MSHLIVELKKIKWHRIDECTARIHHRPNQILR
uniref:Uncharacterized protein n=1 Tax=Arundo donax TaxID=35708 RepID=A0A0A9AKL9_ARUDO